MCLQALEAGQRLVARQFLAADGKGGRKIKRVKPGGAAEVSGAIAPGDRCAARHPTVALALLIYVSIPPPGSPPNRSMLIALLGTGLQN
jgi:hypothetical protein